MILFADEADPLRPKNFKIDVSSLLAATLAINILSLALPVMTLQIYDRILPNPGLGTVNILIGGVCIAVALEMILRLCRCYMLGWAAASYEHRLSCDAMKRVINADLSRQAAYGTGEFLHRISAVSKMKDFYNGNSLITLAELAFLPLFLGLIIYIAGPVAFVPAAVLMVFTIASLRQGQRLREALKRRDQTDDRRYDFLIESLEGIHTLKALALENTFARRYENLEENSTLSNYTVTQATSRTFDLSAVFSNIMVAAVICTGAYFAVQGQLTTGALIAAILLSGRLMQPVNRALSLWVRYQDYVLARDKVEQIFAAPQNTPAVRDGAFKPAREGKLEIHSISFRSKESDPWLINDMTLSLDFGRCVLLDSEAPAENRALFDMISGLYAPNSGEIYVDGHHVMSYPPEILVAHVGVIHSEGTIFRGTIRDNMTCFGQIDEKKAREIAALLKVDHDIGRLPSGFDTYLNGNSTDTISPGLKQRVSMVRVLAQKPRIILFDNADRALDREGYNLVHSLMAQLKGKATLLIVSDDYNIRSLADAHYSLKGGKMNELPTPDAIRKFETYRELRI